MSVISSGLYNVIKAILINHRSKLNWVIYIPYPVAFLTAWNNFNPDMDKWLHQL